MNDTQAGRIIKLLEQLTEAVQGATAELTATARALRAPHVLFKPHFNTMPNEPNKIYCHTGVLAGKQGKFDHCTGIYGAGANHAEAAAAFDRAWTHVPENKEES